MLIEWNLCTTVAIAATMGAEKELILIHHLATFEATQLVQEICAKLELNDYFFFWLFDKR